MSDKVYHDQGHPEKAIAQAERALKMNINNTTLYFLMKMYVKRLIRYEHKDKLSGRV